MRTKKEKLNKILAESSSNLDDSSQLTIFSDTPESRLLAQLRAADLKKHLEKKYPGREIDISITFFPSYEEYTNEAQETDFQDALKNPNLLNYCHAIELLKKNKKPVVPDKQALFDFLLEKVRLSYAIEAISPDNPYDFIIQAWSKNTVTIQKKILSGFLYDIEKGSEAQYQMLLYQFFPNNLTTPSQAVHNIKKSFLIALFKKIPADNYTLLIQYLSQKNASGENALFCMTHALYRAAAKHPAQVNLITDFLILLIKEIPASNFKDFIQALSEKNKDNQNAFYFMMCALWCAAGLNNSSVKFIADCFIQLIKKTPIDNLKDFLQALSEKPEYSENTLQWMIISLHRVDTNPAQIRIIINCFIHLIEKIPENNFKDFIQALSILDHRNSNLLFLMMKSLISIGERNQAQLKPITDCFIRLIEKTPKDNFKDVIQLFPKKNKDDENVLLIMLKGLNLAIKENPTQVKFIMDCFIQLIEKTPEDNFKDLIQLLSEKNKNDENVLLIMLQGLNLAIKESPTQFNFIMDFFIRLIEKTPEDNFKDLIQLLCKKNRNNRNFFLIMLQGLDLETNKNPTQFSFFTDCFTRLIEKTPEKKFTKLIHALSETNLNGKNAFQIMITSFHRIIEEKNAQASSIADCLYHIMKKTNDFDVLIRLFNTLKINNKNLFFYSFGSEAFLDKELNDSDKLSFYKIIIRFTNIFKTKKYGFFSSESTWSSSFKNAEKIKETYNKMFDFFCAIKSSEIDPEILKIFLETARSQEYLIDYCVLKINADPVFYERYILNAGSAIATLVNAQCGLTKTDNIEKQLVLEKKYMKKIKLIRHHDQKKYVTL